MGSGHGRLLDAVGITERRTYLLVEQQIGEGIHVRGFAVDDDELGAIALREQREARRRIYDQRRTDGEEQIT